jgi:hypothetical protein
MPSHGWPLDVCPHSPGRMRGIPWQPRRSRCFDTNPPTSLLRSRLVQTVYIREVRISSSCSRSGRQPRSVAMNNPCEWRSADAGYWKSLRWYPAGGAMEISTGGFTNHFGARRTRFDRGFLTALGPAIPAVAGPTRLGGASRLLGHWPAISRIPKSWCLLFPGPSIPARCGPVRPGCSVWEGQFDPGHIRIFRATQILRLSATGSDEDYRGHGCGPEHSGGMSGP